MTTKQVKSIAAKKLLETANCYESKTRKFLKNVQFTKDSAHWSGHHNYCVALYDENQPRVLHLTLHREWFVEIAEGRKKNEYREIKPYWTKRLEGREYDIIEFRNGYAKSSPVMRVEYKGLDLAETEYLDGEKKIVYAIKLGRILEIKNYESDKTTTPGFY